LVGKASCCGITERFSLMELTPENDPVKQKPKIELVIESAAVVVEFYF